MRRFACWLAYRVGVSNGAYARYWTRRKMATYSRARIEIEERGQVATGRRDDGGRRVRSHRTRRQPDCR